MKLPHPAPNAWYREPWPWLLMAGPAVVVVAGIVTMLLAINTHDGLVADDYYKQGLLVNRTMQRDLLAHERGYVATVTGSANGTVADGLRLELSEGAPVPATLQITFAHATRSQQDQQRLLTRREGRHYEATLPRQGALAEGKWYVTLEDTSRDWRLTTEIVVRGGVMPTIRLGGHGLAPVNH